MDYQKKLKDMGPHGRNSAMLGLSDEELRPFLANDKRLQSAIDEAYRLVHDQSSELKDYIADVAKMADTERINYLQTGFVNFYAADAVNPYIPLAAKGPWVVCLGGSVIFDAGGYGMLGLGHAPDTILKVMEKPFVMANVMTASFWQKRFTDALMKEIGRNRPKGSKPAFSRFIALNSGSESVTIAARISDIHAKKITAPGEKHAGKKIMMLGLKGGFHGRTERPAAASDSSAKAYKKYLASFQGASNLRTVTPNNLRELEDAFAQAKKEGIYFECFFMEPVMGEGNPGLSITPEFYSLARKLCSEEKTLFLVDSIQAGIRAHGCLSIVDYPGFEALEGPDFETYSKALNAGQYPLSVLALGKYTEDLYQNGVYGNTMTTNPRALAVGTEVLSSLSSTLRGNIVHQGKHFLESLRAMAKNFPGLITNVQGCGLLFSVEFDSQKIRILGDNGLEKTLRLMGLGVIHGGDNSLRFTPVFDIKDEEVALVVQKVREGINAHLGEKKGAA